MKHRHPCLPVLELEYVCEDVCEYARMDAELLVTADWVPCKRLLMRRRTAAFGDNMNKKSPCVEVADIAHDSSIFSGYLPEA